eukprot:SAG11_NODE_16376_length_549_cov_0.904444_1_plen_25_part_10
MCHRGDEIAVDVSQGDEIAVDVSQG